MPDHFPANLLGPAKSSVTIFGSVSLRSLVVVGSGLSAESGFDPFESDGLGA